LKHSWYIAVAYVIGFFVLLLAHGWHPNEPNKPKLSATASHGALMPEFNADSDIAACATRSLPFT
jgi:hypothetical protein